ncbi:MAG: RluA family pseudouridine synthase [Candidatus Schekmanbacteria bacterium]|nr:MAG: RluA family pseudouridine synthase [Candidatus Schekmanbacteria bacterium]
MIKNEVIIVEKKEEGKRLDSFLHTRFTNISRRMIQQSIREGNVLLNGKKAKKGSIIFSNDKIEIIRLPEAQDLVPVANPNLDIEILYENEDFFALNKPAGMPCHPLAIDEKETVVNFIIARFPKASNFGYSVREPSILHRLDIDTSGVLLAAKKENTFNKLRNLMRTKKIKKTYLALVLNEMEKDIVIDSPLMHHEKDKRKMKVLQKKVKSKKALTSKKILEAKTEIKRVEIFKGYTLVQAVILTGVMHQIRCHLASIKHPVAGDLLYQSSKQKKQDFLKPKRHLLHCAEIVLPPEVTGKWEVIKSPLPKDFREYIEKLEKK